MAKKDDDDSWRASYQPDRWKQKQPPYVPPEPRVKPFDEDIDLCEGLQPQKPDGWVKAADNKLPKKNNSPWHAITFQGETRSAQEWSNITKIGDRTITARLEKGWTVERALTQPVDPVMSKAHKDNTPKKLKEKLIKDLLSFYTNTGRGLFLKWLKKQFEEDAGKVMKDHFYPNIPKEQIMNTSAVDSGTQKANIQIAFINPPNELPKIKADGEEW